MLHCVYQIGTIRFGSVFEIVDEKATTYNSKPLRRVRLADGRGWSTVVAVDETLVLEPYFPSPVLMGLAESPSEVPEDESIREPVGSESELG